MHEFEVKAVREGSFARVEVEAPVRQSRRDGGETPRPLGIASMGLMAQHVGVGIEGDGHGS